MRKSVYSLVAMALSVSLFIYLFYRSKKTVVNEVASLLFPSDVYTGIRSSIASALPLNEAVLFSLPGGLWIFCMTLLSKDLYLKLGGIKTGIAGIAVSFAIILEFCQLLHLTNGTFDITDIACYLMFWMVAQTGFKSPDRQQDVLSPFTLKGFMCLACFLSVYLAHVRQ